MSGTVVGEGEALVVPAFRLPFARVLDEIRSPGVFIARRNIGAQAAGS